jgi:hypothetical protein
MEWVINNERRPAKDGVYYAIDSNGEKLLADFRYNNWFSVTGHPIAKWMDEGYPSFNIEDMNKLFKYFNNQLYENEGVCFSIDHFHAYMKENYPDIQIDAL